MCLGTTFIHNDASTIYEFECGGLKYSTSKIQSNATVFESSRIRLDLSSITPLSLDPALPKLIREAEKRNSEGIMTQAIDELINTTKEHFSSNLNMYIFFCCVFVIMLIIIVCLCKGRCPCQSGYEHRCF